MPRILSVGTSVHNELACYPAQFSVNAPWDYVILPLLR